MGKIFVPCHSSGSCPAKRNRDFPFTQAILDILKESTRITFVALGIQCEIHLCMLKSCAQFIMSTSSNFSHPRESFLDLSPPTELLHAMPFFLWIYTMKIPCAKRLTWNESKLDETITTRSHVPRWANAKPFFRETKTPILICSKIPFRVSTSLLCQHTN